MKIIFYLLFFLKITSERFICSYFYYGGSKGYYRQLKRNKEKQPDFVYFLSLWAWLKQKKTRWSKIKREKFLSFLIIQPINSQVQQLYISLSL